MKASIVIAAAILAATLSGCFATSRAGVDAANPASVIGALVVLCLVCGSAAANWTGSRLVRGW